MPPLSDDQPSAVPVSGAMSGPVTVSCQDDPSSPLHARGRARLPLQFGDYELLEEIARGGMGVVFRARQVKLNRIVALKMILGGQLANEEQIRRFQTEAEAAAKLEHPGIVPIHEIGELSGQHFFSMGFVEGRSLAVRLREGPLGNRVAAELIRDVAEAVDFAHQHGVIHRDLKPGNVLLKEQREPSRPGIGLQDTGAGEAQTTHVDQVQSDTEPRRPNAAVPPPASAKLHPMLTDFGLAKLVQSDSELTSTGRVMGTPAYMAPEQAAGRADLIGPRSDVYSLGAVLYCALTGRPPFQAAAVLETLQQVLDHDPVSPRQLNPDVDPDLETICLKCLEKQAAQRYASAGELASELGRFLRNEPILARPATAWERAGKWGRRQPVTAALLGVSSLVLTLVAALSVGLYYHRALQEEMVESTRQRDEARSARDELAIQKKEVERQRDVINQQKQDVEFQKTLVEKQKQLVEAERDRTRRIQYTSDIKVADRSWHEDNVGEMFRILYRNSPQTGERDLRGWEWYYLWRQGNWNSAAFRGSYGTRMMAYAPESRHLAIAGVGPIADLWDVKTMQLHQTITPEVLPENSVMSSDSLDSVAITPDGKTLALGFHNGRFMGWDWEARKILFNVQSGKGSRGYVVTADVTPDGQLFVAGDSNGGVRLWDRSGQLVRELQASSTATGGVKFSPDSRQLAVAISDSSIVVFDTETGDLKQTLTGHTGAALCVKWSPDGSLIAGGAYNSETRIWDVATGTVKHVLHEHRGAVNDVSFRPDGEVLATCSADGTVRLWNVQSGALERVLRGHSALIYHVAWESDASRIVTSSTDGTVRIWDLAIHPEGIVIDAELSPINACVTFNRDGTQFAVISREGIVFIRNAFTGQIDQAFTTGPGMPYVVAFHPDGKRLAVGKSDGSVSLRTLESGVTRDLTRHNATVFDLAFSPDGTRLLTGSDDKTARIVEVETGSLLHTLDQHTNFVWAVDWSPDGRWLATSGHDGRLMIWDAETATRVRMWDVMNFPHGMTFSPDSKLIAVPMLGNGVDLHAIETGEVVQTLRGHTEGIGGIAFSPDGQRVFTSSWDRSVKVFDVVTGQETLTLNSADRVNSLALHPQGQYLVGIGEHKLTLWFSPVPVVIRPLSGP